MSPVPVIDLQRRLTLVGAIRAGGEKTDPRRPGAKLSAYRLTSPRRELIEQAAGLYGGDVSRWQSPVGDEWQVYTEARELPVLIMPGYSLRQTYELWTGATKRERLCDGIDEEISGGPCICEREGGDAKCDLYTRLVVALPELDTVLGWRLITRGVNAAHELPTMMQLIEQTRSPGQAFVPARLRIDERKGVKEGQTVRFVVPSLDLGIGYLALATAQRGNGTARALPKGGFTPTERRAPTIDEGLRAVDEPPAPRPVTQRSRVPIEPIAPSPEPRSIPVDDEPPVTPEAQTKMLSDAQAKKLNVLVGTLRDKGGYITSEQLYASIAGLRKLDVETMIELIEGARDEHGVLHWAPLRDTLSRSEAHTLIDWLTVKEERVSAAAPQPGAEASTSAATSDIEPTSHGQTTEIPY